MQLPRLGADGRQPNPFECRENGDQGFCCGQYDNDSTYVRFTADFKEGCKSRCLHVRYSHSRAHYLNQSHTLLRTAQFYAGEDGLSHKCDVVPILPNDTRDAFPATPPLPLPRPLRQPPQSVRKNSTTTTNNNTLIPKICSQDVDGRTASAFYTCGDVWWRSYIILFPSTVFMGYLCLAISA